WDADRLFTVAIVVGALRPQRADRGCWLRPATSEDARACRKLDSRGVRRALRNPDSRRDFCARRHRAVLREPATTSRAIPPRNPGVDRVAPTRRTVNAQGYRRDKTAHSLASMP